MYLSSMILSVEKLINDFLGTCTDLLKFDISSIFITLILAYILGHILSFISSITIERFSIWTLGYPVKYLLGLPGRKGVLGFAKNTENRIDYSIENSGRIILHIITTCLLLPIAVWNFVLGEKLRFNKMIAKPLDQYSTDLILVNLAKSLRKNFGVTHDFLKEEDKDWFRFTYHYVVEHSEPHLPKMQNYVALFGFARTLTLITNICFWLALYSSIKYAELLYLLPTTLIIILISLLTYLLYVDFNKFYRKFSLEVLMAYTIINAEKP